MWAQQPLVQPMGRRPYPSGRHLPHVNFVCRVTPSISALHPNAVDRALAGRALSGHPGGSYPLDLVRPTRKGDIRLIFFLLSLSLCLLTQLSSAKLPLFLRFLLEVAITIGTPRSCFLIPPLSLNKAFVNSAQGCRLATSTTETQARKMNEPGTRNDGDGLSCVIERDGKTKIALLLPTCNNDYWSGPQFLRGGTSTG